MSRFSFITLFLATVLGGCATTRQVQPPHTAREELLLSKAVDNAVHRIRPTLPKGGKVYVDTSHFKGGYDTKYAISSITGQLLRNGYQLVPKKSEAKTIVDIRAGALSINKSSQLWLGVPSITIPIPFAGPFKTPEIDFFKSTERKGIAKFGLTFYNAKSGTLEGSIGPIYGFSHYNHWTILMIGWTNTDLLPKSHHQ